MSITYTTGTVYEYYADLFVSTAAAYVLFVYIRWYVQAIKRTKVLQEIY